MDPDHPDPGAGGQAPMGLLSTLESARPATHRTPSQRRQRQRARATWQKRTAIGLMGGGAVALLVTFSLVVQEGNPEAARWTAPRPTATPVAMPAAASAPASMPVAAGSTARAGDPLAALTAPAARIENIAPAPQPEASAAAPAVAAATSATVPPGAAPTTASARPQPPTPEKAATTQTAAATPGVSTDRAGKADRPTKAGRTEVAREDSTEAEAPSARTAASARSNRPGADDVALVQALMTHTRPRAAASGTPVAATDWAHCKTLTGAPAATCRARHCVQHPRDPVCHAD